MNPESGVGHHISERVACRAGALQVAGYPFSTVRVKCQAHNLSTRTVLRELRGLGEWRPGCAHAWCMPPVARPALRPAAHCRCRQYACWAGVSVQGCALFNGAAHQFLRWMWF